MRWVLIGYALTLHVALLLNYAWHSTRVLELEDSLQQCELKEGGGGGRHACNRPLPAGQRWDAPNCEAYTFYCREDALKSEEKKGAHTKITYEAYACKNSSLMGEVARYLLAEPRSWTRVQDAFRAAFVMDDGVSYLVASKARAGGCARNNDVQIQIVGSFHHTLAICQKFALIRTLRARFVQWYRLLVRSQRGHSAADLTEEMFWRWQFLPRTYDMSDPSQRQRLFQSTEDVPCTGKNRRWIVKQDQHGGRGIIEIESYEELRRKFLDPEMDVCVDQMRDSGALQNDTLEARIAGLQLAFRGGDRQRFRANLDQHRDIVQEIVRPLLWEGKRFVSRVFFAALRTGRSRGRPEQPFSDHGIVEEWEVGGGRYDLFMFDQPYFMRHTGLVSDHSHGKVDAFLLEDLDRMVADLPVAVPGAKAGRPESYVKEVFLPDVAAIAEVCFQAAEKPEDDPESRNVIEPDGSYAFFAGDFIISEDLRVVLLEFSAGMAFDHLRSSPAAGLLPLLGAETARLLFSEFGVREKRNETRAEHRNRHKHSHWSKIAERPLLPHP